MSAISTLYHQLTLTLTHCLYPVLLLAHCRYHVWVHTFCRSYIGRGGVVRPWQGGSASLDVLWILSLALGRQGRSPHIHICYVLLTSAIDTPPLDVSTLILTTSSTYMSVCLSVYPSVLYID